ncbi:hypothetical protein [Hyunsoonleella pacifica]|uniref:Uncharacterized protein n=1 Tax=Hyunsoonleella pacifica TaxID=1080224 RepID=A0A4Q9FNT4_9FLAO|nr:hypothetical protein [Hyunsoonleella pacifica]TBN16339.1 hypothetical protein EYD46_06755 [Hyunsoonleella pacifica]GGD20274.1 hypothetical protein GCM10011368_22730 [Hyunsoonleella pacifica]
MILRVLSILSFCFIVTACNNKPQQTEEVSAKTNSSIITKGDIETLKYLEFALDPKVEILTEPWLPYDQLKITIEDIKKADFSFFEDEQAVFELVRELRKTIPDTLKTQSVLSRITIVENMLYKFDDTQALHTTTKPKLAKAIKELLVSYSNLNFQLNKKIEKDGQRIERPY